MTHFFLALQEAEKAAEAVEAVASEVNKLGDVLPQIVEWCVKMGGNIIAAIIIYVVGRFLIGIIKRLVNTFLERRNVEPTVKSFVKSLVNITLTVLLIIAIISKLGIETTSFAALLASAGVAIGMAFSGNLQNFAGGVIILLLRPFKVGDYIFAQGVEGTVKEIQIFHTVLATIDNKIIYVANGALSSGVITNVSKEELRRVEWTVAVEYGTDYKKVEDTLRRILDEDPYALKDPEPFIVLKELSDSSVDVMMRVWVKASEYWKLYFGLRQKVYETFNKEGIGFPFPQVTVHQGN